MICGVDYEDLILQRQEEREIREDECDGRCFCCDYWSEEMERCML